MKKLLASTAIGAVMIATVAVPVQPAHALGALAGLLIPMIPWAIDELKSIQLPSWTDPVYKQLELGGVIYNCDVANIGKDRQGQDRVQCSYLGKSGWALVSDVNRMQPYSQGMPHPTYSQPAYQQQTAGLSCNMQAAQYDVNGRPAVPCSDGNWHPLN